jgi:GNAT superfamily N-acetyltransferase
VAALRAAAAERLSRDFGHGHWSSIATERGVLNSLRHSKILLAHKDGTPVATLRLATKKPWAIDPAYFSTSARPLYLSDMAVDPERQRLGFGRCALEEATRLAQAWPADAIRLDAYDAAAGAGEFYARCGYREVGRVIYRKTPLIYFELVL